MKKTFVLTNAAGTKTINTEYLDGFQYSTPNTEPLRRALEKEDDATMAVATAGEEEAFSPDPDRMVVAKSDPGTSDLDNMTLSFFPTAEGYYDYENLRYIYQYKDHLGNVRVSYVKNSAGVLQVMDSNDYYPFGMSHLKSTQSLYDPMSIPYNYKYNGKELQETGMYDYGARMYMPDIGRWGQHDPLSEITLDPFGYVYNNPLSYNDPTGMEGENVATENGGDPPVKGASFGGGKYDGGVKSFGLGSDGNLDTEITQLNMNSKTSASSSAGSFALAGGGNGGGKAGSSSKNSSNGQGVKYVPDYSTVSDGNSDVSMNGNPGLRFPDFYTINLSIGGIVGWNGTITVDRHGQIYISPLGATIGKSTTLVSGSLTANWLLQRNKPTASETYNFLSGHGISIGGGYIGGVNWTISPTNTGTQNAVGFGLFSPQAGASYNYTPDTLLGVPLILNK